jgi:hypothetical protein
VISGGRSSCILAVATCGLLSFDATATAIDLRDFIADPEVIVAADGRSAVFTESMLVSFVRLSNDPFLGDANVIVPGASTTLTFDFGLDEAADNNDDFSAYLFDADEGPVLGVLDSFTVTGTQSGPVSFDLAPWVGRTLGLQFELRDLDSVPPGTFGSTATVSNVALVPAPTAAWLLATGIAALGGRRWLRQKSAPPSA